MMPAISEQLQRNMLTWHAGRSITCPGCQSILDCRRAVEIDWYQAGTLKHSGIRCATCFDELVRSGQLDGTAARNGLTFEVIDGRTLWAQSTLPRVRSPRVKHPELIEGRTYRAKHSSGAIRFRLVRIVTRKLWPQDARACTRYHGVNVATGRDVIIKSRGKIYEQA
jgi:hypothetical protein